MSHAHKVDGKWKLHARPKFKKAEKPVSLSARSREPRTKTEREPPKKLRFADIPCIHRENQQSVKDGDCKSCKPRWVQQAECHHPDAKPGTLCTVAGGILNKAETLSCERCEVRREA